MLKLAVVVWIALWPGLAEAIIWEFDDGTTQGWAAKEASILGGGPRGFNQFSGGGRKRRVENRYLALYYRGLAYAECRIDFPHHRARFEFVRPDLGPIPHRTSQPYGRFLLAHLDQ